MSAAEARAELIAMVNTQMGITADILIGALT